MGLIKSGVKYGGLYMIAREGIKAYDKHSQTTNNGQQAQYRDQSQFQQPQQPQQQYQQHQPQYQQPQIQSSRDATGYLHQNWCNGQCNGQCNGSEGYVVREVDPEYNTNINEKQATKSPAY